MKKILLALAFIFIAFTPEKKYKFEFSEAQLNELWIVIDNSNAPHSQVKEIQALIQSQYKGQAITPTSSVKDSTKNK